MEVKEVYKLLPKAKLENKKTVATQTTTDIINQVLEQHNINKVEAQKIAHLFDCGNLYDTSLEIWSFLKYKIPYSVEPGEYQSTKTISRFLYDAMNGTGKNDCKHFSNFTASILDALGYNFVYRFAGYSNYDNYPTHVYVVAKDGSSEVLIDAVINGFDIEKKYNFKIDKKINKNMSLYKLSGFDYENNHHQIGGLFDKVKQFGNWVKEKAVDVKNAAAEGINVVKNSALTVGLAVPRNAFLGLVRLNVRGWATGLDKMSWEKLSWWKDWFGGNRTDLQNAINAGKKNKRIFGVNDNEQLHYMGEPVTVASLLASSAPIISKVVTVLDEAKKISDMVEGVTSKVESTKSLIKKANNGFKKTTGIDVANVIFKKEEGVNINTTTLTPGMFKTPTNNEAMQITTMVLDGKAVPMNTSISLSNDVFRNKNNKKALLIGGAALAALFILNEKR